MTDGERSESQPAAAPPVLDELRSLVERARRGEAAALPPLRRLLDAHPEVWRRAGDLARHVEAAWVDLLAGDDPLGREAVRRRADQLRRELASPASRSLPDARRGERVADNEELRRLLAGRSGSTCRRNC